MNTQLFINVNARSLSSGLVRSLTDMTPVPFPQLVIGDARFYDLFFVDGLGNYADFSGDSAFIPYLAIGAFAYPSGGTFTLTFSGQTTAALAWNASLATVQAALQGLSSVGAGNAIVTGVPGQYYVVTFTGSLGGSTQPEITSDFSLLTPDSTIDVSTIVAGGTGVNCVQLLNLATNPITFADTWTTIANGWTGQLSLRTLQAIEQLAAAGQSFTDLFQVTVADPSGNRTTYFQGNVQVQVTIINPESFAGADKPLLATQAALNAAVLGLNNFTNQSVSNSSGNSNVAPPASSRYHTAQVTITGGASTRTLSVLTSQSPAAGALVRLAIAVPSTAGIVIEVHNATSTGTLLKSITTSGSGRPYNVFVLFNGTAWVLIDENEFLLAKASNLAGLASTLASKNNLATVFNAISNQTSNFTIAATDEGKLFMVSASGGAVVATLPAAGTAGAGFLVALKKTDSSANGVTTSPATWSLAAQGDTVLLESDGSAWNVVLYSNTSGTGGAVTPAVLRLQAVQTGYQLTGLVGGGSTNLDGLATADGTFAAGAIINVYISAKDALMTYRLRAGTDAQNSPWIVRPADYAAGTNQNVWELLRVTSGGYPAVWNSTQSKFQSISATGASGSEVIAFGTGFTLP